MTHEGTPNGSFPVTDRTAITRLAKRGHYDKETIYKILDEALFCTISWSDNGLPFQIPTGFVRMGDAVYIHGSVGSYLRALSEGSKTVSIGATLIDGLVLARSAFHHSVNYRSVILFGIPRVVTHEKECIDSLEAFTEKMVPGRWSEIRHPNPQELKKTLVLSFPIEEASAKVRTGGPVDDEEDYSLDVWAGVVPLKIERMIPMADERLKQGVDLPAYLRR